MIASSGASLAFGVGPELLTAHRAAAAWRSALPLAELIEGLIEELIEVAL